MSQPMTQVDVIAWRRTHALSQMRLARLLGIDNRTLQRWEAGETVPPAFLRRALEQLDRELANAS